MITDYVPRKPRKRKVKVEDAKPIVVQPEVVLCGICNHLKYRAVNHINGSSYSDKKRCMNCPTCKEVKARG